LRGHHRDSTGSSHEARYSSSPVVPIADDQFLRGEVHAALIDFATRAHADFGIAVGRYVILPDHIHLFVAGPDDFNLGKWVGTLKRVLGRAIAMDRSQDPIWQRGFFDHLLRSEESYAQKWDYVRENPVRAQLVEKVEDWPYAGEFVTIYGD
jgi:putative transposase